MLRALWKSWLGGKKKHTSKARRPRLGLEALELREMLSASPTGFSLSGGNLYNTSGTQAQLIDSGVQRFAVANSQVYDLHTNGVLESMNADGSGMTTLDAAVQSFAIAGNGIVALENNGDLHRLAPGSNTLATIGSFGRSSTLFMDPAGSVVILDSSDGHLYRLSPGSDSLETIGKFGLSSPVLMDPSGSVVIFDSSDGHLYRLAPGCDSLQTIGKFGLGSTTQMDSAGSVVILDSSDGSLYRLAPSSNTLSGIGRFGLNSTMRMDPSGSVIILDSSDGHLYRLDPGSTALQTIGTSVASFAIAGDGSLYTISSSDSSLWVGVGSAAKFVLADVQQITPNVDGSLAIRLGSGLSATLSVQGALNSGPLTVNLNNIQLDVNAFAQSILAPIFHTVQGVTQPLEKVAEFLTSPLPVLSSVSHLLYGGDITLASLTGRPEIAAAANAIMAINHLSLPAAGGTVSLGSLTCVEANTGIRSPLALASSQLAVFTSQISSIFAGFEQQVQQIGLDFPILDDPSKLIQLITGQNVPLFTYNLPTLNVPVSGQQLLWTIPTPIGVTVNIYAKESGNVSLSGGFGCDSTGLLSGNLLSSFFVQNLTCALSFSVGLVGDVNVVLAGLDLGGGISAQATLALQGPGGSNTVTGANLANGSDQVAVSGSVSAYADASVWVGASAFGLTVKVASFDIFHVQDTLFTF